MTQSIGPFTPVSTRTVLLIGPREVTIIDARRDLQSMFRLQPAARKSYCADGWARAVPSDPVKFYKTVSEHAPVRGWRYDNTDRSWTVTRMPGRSVHRGPVTLVWRNPTRADVFVDAENAEELIDRLALPDDHLDFRTTDPTVSGWFALINWDNHPVNHVNRTIAEIIGPWQDSFQVVRCLDS